MKTALVRLALVLLLADAPAIAAPAETSCDLAALKAEHDWNLPPGILSAVGTVESGRSGQAGIAPWPWTINAAGHGFHHETKGDSIATVLAIMATGYPYIDVGCFQVDLAHHPGVFRSLDDAFDPDRNAAEAARILLTNRMNSPDWNTAVARYHSALPERGIPYLQKVRGVLALATTRALSAQASAGKNPPPPQPQPVAARLPIVIYGLPLPSNLSRSPRHISVADRSAPAHEHTR